jgi:hypothetical protein
MKKKIKGRRSLYVGFVFPESDGKFKHRLRVNQVEYDQAIVDQSKIKLVVREGKWGWPWFESQSLSL